MHTIWFCRSLKKILLASCGQILLLTTFATPANASQPEVAITYSPRLDSICGFFRGYSIKDEWKQELASRLPEFESLWVSEGPQLIDAAEAVTGKSFPPESVTAHLTLCNLPSQSIIGISVNMRYALKSFTPSPVPIGYKVDTLFHELLHDFLKANPPKNSMLLAKHHAESECTRTHLHLLALQKAVYLKLQKPMELQEIIRIDSQLDSGCYKRGWELVNASDDEYLNYIDEIKN